MSVHFSIGKEIDDKGNDSDDQRMLKMYSVDYVVV